MPSCCGPAVSQSGYHRAVAILVYLKHVLYSITVNYSSGFRSETLEEQRVHILQYSINITEIVLFG